MTPPPGYDNYQYLIEKLRGDEPKKATKKIKKEVSFKK